MVGSPVYIPGVFLCSRNLILSRKGRGRESIQGYYIVIFRTAKINLRCGWYISSFYSCTAITIGFNRIGRSGQRQTAFFNRAFAHNLADIIAVRIHKLIVTIIVIDKLQIIRDRFEPVFVQISGIIAVYMFIIVNTCRSINNTHSLVIRQNLTVNTTDQRFPTALCIRGSVINLGQAAT